MIDVTTVIYTPLQEEFESLQARYKPERDINGDKFTGYRSKGKDGQPVIVVTGFEWGNTAAYEVMREVLSSYRCSVAVCIGIAGAISSDAKLGDVFYSRQVLDLTQRTKQEKDKKGLSRIKYDPHHHDSSEKLAKSLDRSKLSATGQSAYVQWRRACEMVNDGRLTGVNTSALGHPAAYYRSPNGASGKLAATNMVLADTQAVEDVKACGRKMACVDTESAGFAKACKENPGLHHIVIRGISDMADETKKIAEERFSNVFRGIAASNATLFLYYNLTGMLNSISSNALEISNSLPSTPIEAISRNEEAIRDELTRRSIVFKTIENENKMPIPRLRKIDLIGESEGIRAPELEIEDVLNNSSRIQIELPKHYPDAALPWLFAHLLTEPGLDGRYTVPILFDWSNFGPPKNNLDAQLEEKKLEFLKNNNRYRIIFIALEVTLGSKSKAIFLDKEFSTYRNAHLIIFPNRENTSVIDNEISSYVVPDHYSVEGISFTSIAKYVQSNFGMGSDEAEVLANRLLSTFNNYRLKVHPTFLASIQRDTVLSFVEANQRGELIELAVAGLMSLLVADDTSKVVLRRGTRERFLAKLAVEIYSEKRRFNRQELEEYVQAYATKMGFDIVAAQFIKPFVDNGVISFDGGSAAIAVPVIKTYMLAKGLVAQGAAGMDYFNFDEVEFDFVTFDLFSEFTNDTRLYETLSKKLDQSIEYFATKISKYNSPILQGKYRSSFLTKSVDIVQMSKDIAKQGEKLVEATSLLSEKQARLDVRAEIVQSKTAQKVDVSDRNSFANEHIGVSRLIASAVMLGSAAEKMTDECKLDLIGKTIRLSALISTDLLTIYSNLDIEGTVEEVYNRLSENNDLQLEDAEAKIDLRKFVEMVVAEWEFNLAATPIHALTSVLCESGRTNVLLSPISRIKPNDDLEDFYRSSWAFDMDPIGKSHLPKDLSKTLGVSPFLRIMFGISTIERLYWFHHGRARKEALINGVNEMFMPLSIKSDVDLNNPPN